MPPAALRLTVDTVALAANWQWLSAKGGVRVVGGLGRYAVGTVTRPLGRRSLGQRARGIRTMARGAGMVAGAWGAGYREYGRVDG